jgi:hypothetical protein
MRRLISLLFVSGAIAPLAATARAETPPAARSAPAKPTLADDDDTAPAKAAPTKAAAQPAPAAQPAAAASDETEQTVASAPAASYRGVAPGSDALPPHPPRLPVRGPVRVTWPGFQVRDGVPTVFLQLTGPVDWSVAESGDKLVYTLRGAVIPLTNNKRPLRVGEFQTVVKEVSARARGRDVEITIRVRQKVTHHERTTDGAGGFKFLVIELPAS